MTKIRIYALPGHIISPIVLTGVPDSHYMKTVFEHSIQIKDMPDDNLAVSPTHAASFTPYQNKSFMAVKLGPPETFVTFEYVAYAYTADQWIEKDKRTITTKLYDQLPWLFLDRWRRFQMRVLSGGRTKQLKSGMYFAAIKPDGEMDGLRQEMINEIGENKCVL
ncbi:unnamed protein product [Onchocerca ochengi]|uniref:Glyco_hydro_38C domain-containing protein n=1 Tax=Onchocerca ochengi TaxID=42157 RepID=A0A182EQA3_ONCOC|nr:unnamed protein product [Onchocerca ochengi]